MSAGVPLFKKNLDKSPSDYYVQLEHIPWSILARYNLFIL